MIQRLSPRISGLPLEHAAALDEVGVDRHFHLQHIDLILRLGKFLHALRDDLGLDLREFEAFLVAALRIVSDKLEKERNVIGLALGADAFDESVLDVVHMRLFVGRVIKQDFHRVRAIIDNALYRDGGQQIGQAAGLRVVVSAGLVRQ